jgi:hypothetical protein
MRLDADLRGAKEEIRGVKDIAERREREVKVKEREIEFLKSLVVRVKHLLTAIRLS